MKRFPKGVRTGRVFLRRWKRRQFVTHEKPQRPDKQSLLVMAPIDELPPGWRLLVHEYGRNIVLDLYLRGEPDEDVTPAQHLAWAQAALAGWRERKQLEMANAYFIVPRAQREAAQRRAAQ